MTHNPTSVGDRTGPQLPPNPQRTKGSMLPSIFVTHRQPHPHCPSSFWPWSQYVEGRLRPTRAARVANTRGSVLPPQDRGGEGFGEFVDASERVGNGRHHRPRPPDVRHPACGPQPAGPPTRHSRPHLPPFSPEGCFHSSWARAGPTDQPNRPKGPGWSAEGTVGETPAPTSSNQPRPNQNSGLPPPAGVPWPCCGTWGGFFGECALRLPAVGSASRPGPERAPASSGLLVLGGGQPPMAHPDRAQGGDRHTSPLQRDSGCRSRRPWLGADRCPGEPGPRSGPTAGWT